MERLAAPSSPNHAKLKEHNELSARRQAAFDRAQNHSRSVMVMRRLFPVFSILCVCAYFISSEFSFEYKDIKASVKRIEVTKNELKMINPRMEGHDENSGSYLILADTATQKSGSSNLVFLEKINATLEHPQNGTIKLTSNQGQFNTKSEKLWLDGDIVVTGENGMKAQLEKAEIEFKKQLITSNQPVFMQMNGSTIRAERLFIEGGKKIMTFSDRVSVRLIKSPDTPIAPAAKEEGQ